MKIDTYNNLREQIRTGDAIFFAGKGRTSNLIKDVTASKYSHVGMAVWLQPVVMEEPRLFIIESTTLNTQPDVTGEYRRGVQMVPLAQRLEGYDGMAWWLPLREPLNDEEKAEVLEWCW